MKISEIKSSIGKRCRMIDPYKWSWTLPLTGEYIITDYAYKAKYHSDNARLTITVQCENIDKRPISVWVPPERIALI